MWWLASIGVAGVLSLLCPSFMGTCRVCFWAGKRQGKKADDASLRNSSFQNTDLDYQLRQRDITNLVMGGMVANTCLESTARYAYEM